MDPWNLRRPTADRKVWPAVDAICNRVEALKVTDNMIGATRNVTVDEVVKAHSHVLTVAVP
jgi:hypothetical protein